MVGRLMVSSQKPPLPSLLLCPCPPGTGAMLVETTRSMMEEGETPFQTETWQGSRNMKSDQGKEET